MNEAKRFQIDIVNFPATKIAVFEHRGATNLVGRSIAEFISWRKDNALPPSKSKTYNMVYDNAEITEDVHYRFDIACEVKAPVVENQQGVINKTIPEGVCAKVSIEGDNKLGEVINHLYSEWLGQSNYKLRDYPLFLERVSCNPTVPENKALIDIYLPIK